MILLKQSLDLAINFMQDKKTLNRNLSANLRQNESLYWQCRFDYGIAAQALFAIQFTSDVYRSSFSYPSI